MRQPKEDLIFKTTDLGPNLADVVAQCTGVEGGHSPTHFYLSAEIVCFRWTFWAPTGCDRPSQNAAVRLSLE